MRVSSFGYKRNVHVFIHNSAESSGKAEPDCECMCVCKKRVRCYDCVGVWIIRNRFQHPYSHTPIHRRTLFNLLLDPCRCRTDNYAFVCVNERVWVYGSIHTIANNIKSRSSSNNRKKERSRKKKHRLNEIVLNLLHCELYMDIPEERGIHKYMLNCTDMKRTNIQIQNGVINLL